MSYKEKPHQAVKPAVTQITHLKRNMTIGITSLCRDSHALGKVIEAHLPQPKENDVYKPL